MSSKNLSLVHLVREPKTSHSNQLSPLLLLIHGYGSNERDLFGFAESIHDDFFVISVRAPLTLYADGFSWFDISLLPGEQKHYDIPQAKKSINLILQVIEEIKENYPVNPAKVFLGGFSQGAIMSYSIALSYPEKIAGIIAMSGFILKDLLPEKVAAEKVKALHLMATHGTADNVLPITLGRMAIDYMKSHQIPIHYKEYPIAHGVSPECFQDIMNWLNKAYDATNM